jgi:pyridoxal/pyridoxine/pyridoxamine kinase
MDQQAHTTTSGKSQPPNGLGDLVAAAFASVGITKDRAQAVANAIGVEDCGCERRRQRLNDLGRMVGIVGPPPPSAPENQGSG